MRGTTVIGLISDTHGLLRPEALELLKGCDFIVHAGDIGDPEIIAELAEVAPVTAIRDNFDKGSWAQSLPETDVLEVGEAVFLYVLHDVGALDLDPVAAGFQVVVSGHSHKPGFRWKDGVLYVNPGSAGPRRFSLPVSVGHLFVAGRSVSVEIKKNKFGLTLSSPLHTWSSDSANSEYQSAYGVFPTKCRL